MLHTDAVLLSRDHVATLLAELRAIYGAKFDQQWTNIVPEKMEQVWAQHLGGLSQQEMQTGIAACMLRPWPPTLPEFMRLCRPWMEPEIAFQQAVKGLMARQQGKHGYWAHPAVYWAALRIGNHDMLSGSWQTLKTRWEAAFGYLLAQKDLHPVPEPAQALPAPGSASLSREEAHRLAAQVRQMTGETATPASKVTDTKAWARRILDNPKGRTHTVAKMARRALGLDTQAMQLC